MSLRRIAYFFSMLFQSSEEESDNFEKDKDFIMQLPYEILSMIFEYIDPKELVKNCSPVCKNWNRMIISPEYWIERSKKENCREILPPNEMLKDPQYGWNYAKIYVLKPFNRNLILNPSGEDGFNGWQSLDAHINLEIQTPGGHLESSHPDVNKCFVSSYMEGRKFCNIDLRNYGLTTQFLDKYKPTIYVSEMNSYREDAAAWYSLRVELNDGNIDRRREAHFDIGDRIIRFRYEKIVDQWTDSIWEKVEHIFSGYPDRSYCIFFDTIGKDRMFWAGNYGSKFCNATVMIKYEFNQPYVERNDFVSSPRAEIEDNFEVHHFMEEDEDSELSDDENLIH
uniref:F-box domain-containing protein n=1 Tax=Parastrongyloides trichosuri TaxID=131310 RepID=A0A0N4ZMV5_PARTI